LCFHPERLLKKLFDRGDEVAHIRVPGTTSDVECPDVFVTEICGLRLLILPVFDVPSAQL